MQPVSHIVRITLPNYLAGLPIPDSFTGWFKLGVTDWAKLVPFFAAVGGLSYTVYKTIKPNGQINAIIKKDVPKVADCLTIEELGDKAAFCRCWKSKKWPYCDGSHGEHNKQTGDNVGPVVISKNK